MSHEEVMDVIELADYRDDFQYPMFGDEKIRTIIIDRQIWWSAKDVCNAIGVPYSFSYVVKNVYKEDWAITRNNAKSFIIVNNFGLFRLFPEKDCTRGDQFRNWVTQDVLPQYFRHRMYMSKRKMRRIMETPKLKRELMRVLMEFYKQNPHELRAIPELKNLNLDNLEKELDMLDAIEAEEDAARATKTQFEFLREKDF